MQAQKHSIANFIISNWDIINRLKIKNTLDYVRSPRVLRIFDRCRTYSKSVILSRKLPVFKPLDCSCCRVVIPDQLCVMTSVSIAYSTTFLTFGFRWGYRPNQKEQLLRISHVGFTVLTAGRRHFQSHDIFVQLAPFFWQFDFQITPTASWICVPQVSIAIASTIKIYHLPTSESHTERPFQLRTVELRILLS